MSMPLVYGVGITMGRGLIQDSAEMGCGQMTIQVLGTGCPKCKMLTENVEAAVADLGIEADIVKISEINDILDFGVMMTPALVVDGQTVLSGKVPSVEEIKAMLG